jgi:hypothetical protein
VTDPIFALADIATEAHTRIQQDFADINPVVGVRRSMRENGIPADAMTIDCLTRHKRIILILHDNQPDTVHYQFGFTDKDPVEEFKSMPLAELSAQTLYDWIASYFARRTQ